MKRFKLVIKSTNVDSVQDYQITDNIDTFDILRVTGQSMTECVNELIT